MTLRLYMKLGREDAIVITSPRPLMAASSHTRHVGLSQVLLEDGELAVRT